MTKEEKSDFKALHSVIALHFGAVLLYNYARNEDFRTQVEKNIDNIDPFSLSAVYDLFMEHYLKRFADKEESSNDYTTEERQNETNMHYLLEKNTPL